MLHELARQALDVLRNWGVATADGTIAVMVTPAGAAPLDISYRGPDLPDTVPRSIADAGMVAAQPADWVGAHRLVIRAPLVVLDLCWNVGEPLRIMGFSRGEWEDGLMGRSA